MAKKTRTELSTLAINTNLPDNTTELITPTTERAQLTDERESVVNYKDDLGGTGNAGKFLTVAVDGESLTMVDEPSGVPAWVTFATGLSNLMKLLSGTNNVQIQFLYDDGGVDTLGARISFLETSKTLLIINDFYTSQLSISNQFNFSLGGFIKLRIETTGDLTHNADIMALNAQQSFGSNPLYTFKFQGKVTGPSGGSFTFEEFANIKGGKENATENDKAGYLSFTTGIADGTLTERLRITSGGNVGIATDNPLTINGTTSAGSGLHVNASSGYGVSVLDGADGSQMFFNDRGASENSRLWRLLNNDGSFSINAMNDDISVKSSALTISSGGVVSIPYGVVFNNNSVTGDKTSVTLNDYEEGTYTATVIPSDAASGTITLDSSYNTLTYTKIGRMVTVTGYCIVDYVSNSPTGTISIPLPFTQASGETFYSAASVEFNNVVSSALNEFWCQVAGNNIVVYRSTGSSVSATTAQQMQTNTDFRVCATYFI